MTPLRHLFPSLILLCLAPDWGLATQGGVYQDGEYGPPSKQSVTPAKITYSSTDRNSVKRVQSVMSKRGASSGDDDKTVAIKTSYGLLLDQAENGYQSFSYLTGLVDSERQLTLDASYGRFLPQLNSEFLLTHRIHGAEVSEKVEGLGTMRDLAVENAFAASYTRFLAGPMERASLQYRFSHLPGHEYGCSALTKRNAYVEQWQRRIAGFSEVTTHQVKANLVLDFGDPGLSLTDSLRMELQMGYDSAIHGTFYNIPKSIDEGISGKATIWQQTTFGSIQSWYSSTPSKQTFYAGFQRGGLEVYYKDIAMGEDLNNRMVGVALSFSLDDLDEALTVDQKTSTSQSQAGYAELDQLRHLHSLAGDTFAASPQTMTGYSKL
jgi:hypothetical protein